MLKKSGILLAVLVLSTLTLASSASAQTAPTPAPAAQAVVQIVPAAQPALPLPAFLTAPAVETPAVAPANGSTGLEWLSGTTNIICRCSKTAPCGPGFVCCHWPGQNCGYCCM